MKRALIFPGIGYHADKPLLYYSKRLARSAGYELTELQYPALDPRNMQQAIRQAAEAAAHQLSAVQPSDELLVLSKSIGTAAASLWASSRGLTPTHLYFTPIDLALPLLQPRGLVFHGTADPWADTTHVQETCQALGLPLHRIERGNHSLETGDVAEDLRILAEVMARCAQVIV